MPLRGHVFTAPPAVRGFDANVPLTSSAAAAFFTHGYQFCVRYIRRDQPHAHDLNADEAAGILEAGLGLMPVQHVESEQAWAPSADKGAAQGSVAVAELTNVGVPPGVTIWCDLEGVAIDTPPQHVIDYCNAWHQALAAAGYVPGLYVGWRSGLTPTQLHSALRFTHFWGAYNLNADEEPAVRGVQMRQRARKQLDHVASFDFEFDVNAVHADALGGRPTLVAPEGWLNRVTG